MERLVELTLLVFLCLLFTSCMRYSVRELREEGIGRTSQDRHKPHNPGLL